MPRLISWRSGKCVIGYIDGMWLRVDFSNMYLWRAICLLDRLVTYKHIHVSINGSFIAYLVFRLFVIFLSCWWGFAICNRSWIPTITPFQYRSLRCTILIYSSEIRKMFLYLIPWVNNKTLLVRNQLSKQRSCDFIFKNSTDINGIRQR